MTYKPSFTARLSCATAPSNTIMHTCRIDRGSVWCSSDDESYFAIGGPCLDFLPKNGMTIDDLALQFIGSEWIAAQGPVSLAESRPGDDSIPSGIERRRALEELGRQATGDSRAEIMEGLFLRNSRQYLGLFRVPNESQAVICGLDTPIRVGHDRCSAWRRLAWGVGQWIKSQGRP